MANDMVLSVSSSKNMSDLRIPSIALRVMDVMKNHIGEKQKISREKLFAKLFNRKLDINKLDHWVIWEYIKKSMRYLRVHSNCFIVSHYDDKSYYFVLKTEQESEYYKEKLDNLVKRVSSLKKRADKAVEQKWYQQEWQLGYKSNRLLK